METSVGEAQEVTQLMTMEKGSRQFTLTQFFMASNAIRITLK